MGANQLDAVGALGDPTRRAIFERLVAGPLAVNEIASGLPVSRPAVSQHLKVLKEVGLVQDRKVGNRRLYAINPGGIAAILQYFNQFWNQALQSFKTIAERSE